jgi:hypothetical protein
MADFTDYLPNFFGGIPTMYQGLLTDPEQAALQKRANLGGLLGFGAALAQGMTPQGAPRSGLQNVLSALGAGFGGAAQTYESSLNQMANAQKLQQSQAQIQAINQLLQDPEIAKDPAAVAYIRSNPADAIKYFSEMRMFQRERERGMPSAVTTAATTTGGLPTTEVSGNVQEIANLERQIQGALADARAFSGLRDPVKAEASARVADRLRERQQQLMAAETDLAPRIANAPESYKEQYRTLQSLRESLKPQEFITALQKIDTEVAQSRKQFKFEGLAGNFAYQMFGTNDMTQLNPEQNALVLKFANAPTEADKAKIFIDTQKLKFETGVGVPIPTSREEMINRGAAPLAATTVPTSTMAGRNIDYLQALAREEGAVPAATPAPAPAPAPATTRVRPSEPVVTRVSPVEPMTPQEAKQVVKEIKQPTVAFKGTPLINSSISPKARQELLLQQPATIGLVDYSITQLVDARDAAQALLNNNKQIKGITGVDAILMTKVPETEAYSGAANLENLQTRSFVTEIQRMRAASPTGGAVGNVTEKEMAALSNIQATLKLGMKESELRKQLQQYIDSANRALRTIPQQYAKTYGYNGEFDEVLKGGIVKEAPAIDQVPAGVKVRKVVN